MSEFPEAIEVTLIKVRPLAPPFHRHIARSQLLGKAWRAGDRIVVYEIAETIPEGTVVVTNNSVLHFK